MHTGSPTQEIDLQERGFLLSLARESIRCRLAGEPAPSPESVGGVLIEIRGAFVTLKIDGRLRGCIGHVVGVEPLWQAVQSNAVAAAFDDPRFEPLRDDELDNVHIEISALSPLHRVDTEDVMVGRDGILIERGPHRGLLLPQVAVEYGWDRETFLDHTCRKAGLEPGCWRHADTIIWAFSAEVFGES